MRVANDIVSIIEKHKDDPGIDVHKLKPGTKIEVRTVRSFYEFEVVGPPGYLMARGGKHIDGRQKIYFSGSTYGGSMIRQGWIGQGMNMEFICNRRRISTTIAKEASIVGDNWEYKIFSPCS